jgi:hypothetical protein
MKKGGKRESRKSMAGKSRLTLPQSIKNFAVVNEPETQHARRDQLEQEV